MHLAMAKNNVAVVTGGASGIGYAAALRFLSLGMRVCIADVSGPRLSQAEEALKKSVGEDRVMACATDVTDADQIRALEKTVRNRFGRIDVVMNNAGIQPGSSIFDAEGNWDRIIETNMWGIIRGSQIFAPGMIADDRPALIVNTGSKQGITTPPGDPAYNVAKAGVKAFTEALQHALRNTENCQVEARLFIPGFVFTPLTANGRTEKPAGAWTPDEVVTFLFDALGRDDFYILCPDNEVDRATDEKRIIWAAQDITENRPPLSRWHPDFGEAFARWLKD